MSVNGQYKDEALVIKSLRHGETSRIVTLFTQRRGKVAVIAKGARRGKSGASGGAVDAFNLIEVLIYSKATRSVQTLGQVSALKSFPEIKKNLTLTGYASAIVEHLNYAFTDGEPNTDAFEAAVTALDKLEKHSGDPRINFWLFQLVLLQAVGFALDPVNCPVCSKPAPIGTRNIFLLDTGAICCKDCQPDGGVRIMISGETVSILRQLANGNDNTINRLKPSRHARGEITDTLERYLKHHHSGIGRMPALKMLKEFEDIPA